MAPAPPPPLGRARVERDNPTPHGWRTSRRGSESLRAAERLSQSPRVRQLVFALGGLAYSTLITLLGWAGGKLDNTRELGEHTKQLATVNGSLLVLAAGQRDLKAAVVPRLDASDVADRYFNRDLVGLTAACFAGESPARRRLKASAADDFGRAYDRKIDEHLTPSSARAAVIDKIAIP